MKTSMPFYHKVTKVKSNCGDPLEITLSSKELEWDGILLEKGTSPRFHPKDVITSGFYFAVELENSFSWSVINDGREVFLKTEPGDIWINPPNTPFTHNIDVPCKFIIINISEELMYKSFDSNVPDGLVFLNNYNIQDSTLEHLIQLLYIEVETGGENGRWFIENIMKLFSNYFIRHYSNYNDVVLQAFQSSIVSSVEMKTINKFIEDNMSRSIAIEELAGLLNVSKFHFLNEFKKFNGITPYQHILNKRIEAAKKMLKSKDKSVTAIAYDLGFSDSSHFSRTFKKATGVSPKVFRE